MNRTVGVSLLMSFALCFLAGGQALAQFSEESVTRHWEKLPDGVQILRLWTDKDRNAGEPQIAILRFSSRQQFEKFYSNAKDYLQRNKVFGDVKLGRIISYADISEPYRSRERSKGPDPMTIVAEHNLWCDSAIIQYDSQ